MAVIHRPWQIEKVARVAPETLRKTLPARVWIRPAFLPFRLGRGQILRKWNRIRGKTIKTNNQAGTPWRIRRRRLLASKYTCMYHGVMLRGARFRVGGRSRACPAIRFRDEKGMSGAITSADCGATPCVNGLLDEARQGEAEPLGQLLQLYRNYLIILATTQLDRRLRRRMSPSDLVQETMLAAYRDFGQFRGGTEREFLAWLRQILINCLHHAIEAHLGAKMRDVRCEVSIEQVSAALDRTAVSFAQVLADRGPSPSAVVRQRERVVALADQLAKLRPHYRDVIVLRNLQGLPFDEVAERMNRRPGAVRMLWLRAIEKFKQVYDPAE